MEQYERYLINALVSVAEKIEKYQDDDITIHMYREVYDRFMEVFMRFQIDVKGFDVDSRGIDIETLETELEEAI